MKQGILKTDPYLNSFNLIEEVIFAASFYARMKWQVQQKSLSHPQAEDFLRKLKDSGIIIEALKFCLAVSHDKSFETINSAVGDFQNKEISQECMESMDKLYQLKGIKMSEVLNLKNNPKIKRI